MDDIFRFENSFSELGSDFYQSNPPTKVKAPKLVLVNQDLANFLDLKLDFDKDEVLVELSKVFSGNQVLKSSKPLSMAYSGHQFGHFSPVLGDGRAHLIGELYGKDKSLYDIQLKGSGRSEFSRSGDGRSPLGPAIREYIMGEAMHSLGVPTTRSLAVVETGEEVIREEGLAGGVLTRVSSSLIRVGTFEYFAARRDTQNLKTLLSYLVKRSYPELDSKSEDLPFSFFKEVLKRQADLVAKWMSLGFIHGVMNTDNTSAVGITIDYGPCAFMDETDFDKVYSFIDRNGRYAYSNQPLVLNWNLARLAEALISLYPEKEIKEVLATFKSELDSFMTLYEQAWLKLMFKKMGLLSDDLIIEKKNILNQFLKYLDLNSIDFTQAFRGLSKILTDDEINFNIYKDTPEFREIIKKWKVLVLSNDEDGAAKISEKMNMTNPIYIPRNHLVEESIVEAYKGNYSLVEKLNTILKSPFIRVQDDKIHEKYSAKPKEEEKVQNTFCGT